MLDSSILTNPIIGDLDNVVSLGNANSASVYSLAAGALILNVPAQADLIWDLKLSNNVLLLSRHNTSLTAYEITSGTKLWEVRVPSRSQLSLAANSTYAILSADDQIRVYDLQTGKLLKDKTYGALTGELVLEGDTLFLCYVENRNWYVVSIQLDTLHDNWLFDAGEIAPPYLSLENDQLYAYKQTRMALNKDTGKMLWKDEAQDNYSAPAVLGNDLYYTSLKGVFHKNVCNLETATGMMKECVTLLRPRNSFQGYTLEVTGPIIVDDMLIIAQGSEVSAYQLEP